MRKLLRFKNTRRETIILDSHVEVLWWTDKQRYIDLGYTYTGHGDKFWCKVEDLYPQANVRVNVRCPVCQQDRDVAYRTIEQSGHTMCKGCSNTWDLTGIRFGRLVALEVGKKSNRNGTLWICQCDCGNTHLVASMNLLSEHIVSCGCYLNEVLKAKVGEKNHRWRHDLTDKDRKRGRICPGYHAWRAAVLDRDNRTCQVCSNDGNDGLIMHVHHFYSYKHHPAYRTEIWNGITLCEVCHTNFHLFMGGMRVKCTLADFCDWLIDMT